MLARITVHGTAPTVVFATLDHEPALEVRALLVCELLRDPNCAGRVIRDLVAGSARPAVRRSTRDERR